MVATWFSATEVFRPWTNMSRCDCNMDLELLYSEDNCPEEKDRRAYSDDEGLCHPIHERSRPDLLSNGWILLSTKIKTLTTPPQCVHVRA